MQILSMNCTFFYSSLTIMADSLTGVLQFSNVFLMGKSIGLYLVGGGPNPLQINPFAPFVN